MKRIQYIFLLFTVAGLFACKKTIDLYPESNLNTGTYYTNLQELNAALAGVYNRMQAPLFYEWQLTELRSDNAKQGSAGSTSSTNRDLSDLDMFSPSTSHQANYQYWLNTYNNIRNANILLQKMGVIYDPAAGTITFNANTLPISEADRKQIAGEAMFIRAYHYFNLVRLYGGVFLVYEPISPDQAKTMSRASVQDIYKLIEADLKAGALGMNPRKFASTNPDLGRATPWAAKALLGKVYLTQGKKTEAIPVLQDVKDNSGHGLLPSYANVFSTTNEMNAEIIFAVRFKAGGLGLGSRLANLFAPLGSGSSVINGDGDGLNYPTAELDTATNGDNRKAVLIGEYGARPATSLYPKKFITAGTQNDDAENDWPVIRYPDVLMMLAEAQGYTPTSIDLINSVRPRAGLPLYTTATLPTVAAFEQALSNERRIEFAFENQRWFDLVRFNTTLTTITAEQVLKDHFTDEFFAHYRLYVAPAPTLAELHANVTREKLLLPIPQREIDTNTGLVITQNPGYN